MHKTSCRSQMNNQVKKNKLVTSILPPLQPSQTRLVTKAVQGLLLNPEEDKNTALARKDNEFVNKRCSLTNNFGPGTNDDTNEQQTYLEKRVDEAFNDKFPNPNPFFFSKRSTKHTQVQE